MAKMANSVNRRVSESGWGYTKDVVETVKANACDLKLDEKLFRFEED